jgi:hypothetical protein
MKTSCPSLPDQANADMILLLVKEATLLNEKLVIGIRATKDIEVGQEIILTSPKSVSYPCACAHSAPCSLSEVFKSFGDQFKDELEQMKTKEEELKFAEFESRQEARSRYHDMIQIKKKLPDYVVTILQEHKLAKARKGTFIFIF